MTCTYKRITTLFLLFYYRNLSSFEFTFKLAHSVWRGHDVKYILCCGLRLGYFELKTGLFIRSLRCSKSISSIIFLACIFLDSRFDVSIGGFGRCLLILITLCPFLTLFTMPFGRTLRSPLICLNPPTLGNIKAFLLLTPESPEPREDALTKTRRQQIQQRRILGSWNDDQS